MRVTNVSIKWFKIYQKVQVLLLRSWVIGERVFMLEVFSFQLQEKKVNG